MAKTLWWHKGSVVVTDGPYAETKEQRGGIGIARLGLMWDRTARDDGSGRKL
jgi:hypothetical protein